LGENDVFGQFFLDNLKISDFQIQASQNTVIYLLNLSDYLGVLTNFRDLAKEVMEGIENQDRVLKTVPV